MCLLTLVLSILSSKVPPELLVSWCLDVVTCPCGITAQPAAELSQAEQDEGRSEEKDSSSSSSRSPPGDSGPSTERQLLDLVEPPSVSAGAASETLSSEDTLLDSARTPRAPEIDRADPAETAGGGERDSSEDEEEEDEEAQLGEAVSATCHGEADGKVRSLLESAAGSRTVPGLLGGRGGSASVAAAAVAAARMMAEAEAAASHSEAEAARAAVAEVEAAEAAEIAALKAAEEEEKTRKQKEKEAFMQCDAWMDITEPGTLSLEV